MSETIIEITTANVTTYLTLEASQVTEIDEKLFSLSPLQKISIRKLNKGDTSVINAMSQFFEDHPETIPSNFPKANIQLAIGNYRKLKEIEVPTSGMLIKIETSKLVCGSIIKTAMDSLYAYLKKEVNNNEAYRPMYDMLKALYERSSKNKPEVRSIDENASVTIEGFVSGTRLANVGEAVIEISIGASAGKDPLVLVPGDSWIIPKETKTLFIKNKLATDEAHYSIRMKNEA